MKFSKKDYLIALGFILLAFLIRIPNISYPPELVFDEFHYANFAVRTLHGEADIDVHPPLMRIVFAGVLDLFSNQDAREIKPNENYGDFPYVPMRLLSVLVGSLLAGIIFLLAKKIYNDDILSALPALFVVFDGALVSYSRLILPDIYILFFGFLGILLLFSRRWYWTGAAGLLIGCAASIKWSGAGFLAAGIIFLFLEKRFKEIFLLAISLFVSYLLIFSILFPLESLKEVTEGMLHGHLTAPGHIAASRPYEWPFIRKTFVLWGSEIDSIKLVPNIIAWAAVPISVLAGIALALMRREKELIFLIGGFVTSYLPFFFIGRSLFIYHYFPALIFGFLLIPGVIDFISRMIWPETKNRLHYIFAGLVVLFFLISLPFIY
ncbi:hypothetical protein A3B18_02370 [Candidatus Giovannonibacteria bacterium RIFCSPLOWO2_01_FULL_46_13]|uniref:Polyprenol-phosphate-mannose--protein mannosyltransferase n=1 Tax=Candidatus Giovannonibacteria bacterium RIFCSPLOWO2_01_FULL_46_13 TaxID=1798352 RepID=A0A1F5X572_9BACT|nr:MAG: hypothetical protein A3B18_02370 [Candidatus Giovannonibacteria bacterium RIFCSPLOWO2_01_FULL_46_13]